MTKSYIIEENIEGFQMELSVYDNGFLQFVQTVTISYGTLYSYLHSFNISVEDENNKIKITNHTNNKYKILLKNDVLDLTIILYQEDVLSPTSLFSNVDLCGTPVQDELNSLDISRPTTIQYNGIIYLKNTTTTFKEVSIEKLNKDLDAYFDKERIKDYVNSSTQNKSISFSTYGDTVNFCLAPDTCPPPECEISGPSVTLRNLYKYCEEYRDSEDVYYIKDIILLIFDVEYPIQMGLDVIEQLNNIPVLVATQNIHKDIKITLKSHNDNFRVIVTKADTHTKYEILLSSEIDKTDLITTDGDSANIRLN